MLIEGAVELMAAGQKAVTKVWRVEMEMQLILGFAIELKNRLLFWENAALIEAKVEILALHLAGLTS